MYLNVCASFSWDKEQSYKKCERKKKRRQVACSKRVFFQISQISTLLFPMFIRELKQRRRRRQREQQKINRIRYQNNNFARAFHAFLYISLPTLHDYDVKMPNFLFCGELKHKAMTFFPDLRYSLLEFSSGKICQHLTN